MKQSIIFLSDFGYDSPYVGICKGVMWNINCDLKIIDLTHSIPAFNIIPAIFILKNSFAYFPPNSVFLSVVDPGVGSKRKGIIVKAYNRFFVGPNNGMFSFIEKACIQKIVSIENNSYFLPSTSNTFHGRDIFSPASAFLLSGTPMEKFGPKLKNIKRIKIPQPQILPYSAFQPTSPSFSSSSPSSPLSPPSSSLPSTSSPPSSPSSPLSSMSFPLSSMSFPRKRESIRHKSIIGEIIYVDSFGNLISNIEKELIEKCFPNPKWLKVVLVDDVRSKKYEVRLKKTYSAVKPGEPLALINSFNLLEISVNCGSAQQYFNKNIGSKVIINPLHNIY